MSVASTIATIKSRMTDFKTELVAALSKPVAQAPHAEVADKLDGKTPTEVIALLKAEVTKHTSKIAQGVHKVNLETLGTFTKDQFDAKLDLLMDGDSDVPLSFYGDREFLPPGVTGSFESGSQATPNNYVVFMLEDNGTMMLLRTGTDGDTMGVYYSYLRDAMNQPTLDNLVMSNVRYQPAYFPSDQMAIGLLNGSQDVIIGVLGDKVTLQPTAYFVSITNNTMDQSKHTGYVVPLNGFITTNFPTTVLMGVPSAYIKDGWVYFLNDLDREGKVGWRVWRTPIAQVISGVYVPPERVTGWTVNRGVKGTAVMDDIILFDQLTDMAKLVGDLTYFNYAVSNSAARFPMVLEDGRVLFTRTGYFQITPADLKVNIPGFGGCYAFEIPDSKVIDLAEYHNSPCIITYSSGSPITVNTSPFNRNINNSWPAWVSSQVSGSMYITKFGQQWLWNTVSYYSTRTIFRATYALGTPLMGILNGTHGPNASSVSPVSGRHGSDLSTVYMSQTNYGEYTMSVSNDLRPEGLPYDRYAVRCELVGEPTFQYSSLTGNYAFFGFSPTPNRLRFDKLPHKPAGALSYRLLNESDPTGWKVSGARFHPIMGDIELTRPGNVDANIVESDSVSISRPVLNSLLAELRAYLISLGTGLYEPDPSYTPVAFELIVPQRYTDMPPFVVGYVITAERKAYNFVCSVNITQGNRQSIQNATLLLSSMNINPSVLVANMNTLSYMGQEGQTVIRRVAGGFVVGSGVGVVLARIGDTTGYQSLLTYSAGVWKHNGTIYDRPTNSPLGWVNLPSRGMFITVCSELLYGAIDAGSKTVGGLVCTTNMPTEGIQACLNKTSVKATAIIFLSQKTVTAWTVYFSDPAPAMLDGTYQIVEATTYLLNQATDANKTFHVWLVKRNGVLSYQVVPVVTTTPTAEATLYLGYFTTDGDGLAVVAVEKHTAVGGFMISRIARGSAIPLTSGTPNSAGRLNWK